MLGVDSRLSKLKEKIFGYKGVLNSEKRTLQSEVKEGEGTKSSTSKESEELKASRRKNSSGRKKNPKRRALANASNAIERFGVQVHSDIMRELRVYYKNNESRIANDFVAVFGNDLYIIDSGIEENGEINYGVYDVLHIESDVDVDDYRNELESEIKENGGYKKSRYNTKHSSRKVSNIVGHEDTLHGQGPSGQGVRTSNGTSSNDTGGVSGSSGSSGNGTRRTNVLLDETKGTGLDDTQAQKEEVKFSKNKSDKALFHDIFEILGITKKTERWIKENGGYKKSWHNNRHSSREVSSSIVHGDVLHGRGPSGQGVRTSNGTSSNDTGGVSGRNGSDGNGTRRTNVSNATKGSELEDTQAQKEEVKFSKNKSDKALFHDIFEILGITKKQKG